MTPEEQIKKLEADLAAEKTAREADKNTYAAEVKKKDDIITQKNDDLVKQRQGYRKKLEEMSETEKAAMSEKEVELQQRQEELEANQAKFEQNVKEQNEKEVTARKERIVAKLAGKNEELKAKILKGMTEIVDSDKAQTEEEIAVYAEKSFNMLGVPKPEPVNNAMNGFGGRAPGEIETGGFADTDQGKGLAEALGINIEAPKA